MIGGTLQYAPLFSNFFGGGFGSVLNNLQQMGFFSYMLPFLLIFALIFGILTRMGLFKENRAVTAIIALAVALMALQFNTVPLFFSQIFPSLGIGISIILVILILIGLFTDPTKPGLMITLLVISAIIALVVIVQSSGIDIGTWVQYNLGDTAGTLVIIGIVVAIVAVIISSGKEKREKSALTYKPFLAMAPEK